MFRFHVFLEQLVSAFTVQHSDVFPALAGKCGDSKHHERRRGSQCMIAEHRCTELFTSADINVNTTVELTMKIIRTVCYSCTECLPPAM